MGILEHMILIPQVLIKLQRNLDNLLTCFRLSLSTPQQSLFTDDSNGILYVVGVNVSDER